MKTNIVKQIVECHLRLKKGVKPVVGFVGDTVVLKANLCGSILSNIVLCNSADQQVLNVLTRIVDKECTRYQKIARLEEFEFPTFIKLGTYVMLSSKGAWYFSSTEPERQGDRRVTSSTMHLANYGYTSNLPKVLKEDWGKVVLVKREGYTEVIYNE